MYAKLTFPERLKDLRVMQKHLTLEELAEQTGLSKSALGKYETDDYKDISPFAIVTLAEFYGVSTDYLLGLTETKNHPNTTLDELHLSDEAIREAHKSDTTTADVDSTVTNMQKNVDTVLTLRAVRRKKAKNYGFQV